MNFWDFTYTPHVEEFEIITERETVTRQTSNNNTTTVTEKITTVQYEVSTNWGDIARYGVILLLTYSICWAGSKLFTVWHKGR